MKEERIIADKDGNRICKKCKTEVSYSEKFDTYYCEKCNLWLEERCVDPLCKLCVTRPVRPVKKRAPLKKKKTHKVRW